MKTKRIKRRTKRSRKNIRYTRRGGATPLIKRKEIDVLKLKIRQKEQLKDSKNSLSNLKEQLKLKEATLKALEEAQKKRITAKEISTTARNTYAKIIEEKNRKRAESKYPKKSNEQMEEDIRRIIKETALSIQKEYETLKLDIGNEFVQIPTMGRASTTGGIDEAPTENPTLGQSVSNRGVNYSAMADRMGSSEEEQETIIYPTIQRSISAPGKEENGSSECVKMTTKTDWPDKEGCIDYPVLITLEASKGDNITTDRMGLRTGAFSGINTYSISWLNKILPGIGLDGKKQSDQLITPYMNRVIKEFSPLESCVKEYNRRMENNPLYNKYKLNPQYKGIIQVFSCSASGNTTWINREVRPRLEQKISTMGYDDNVDDVINRYFSGAHQGTFAIPKCYEISILKEWYNCGDDDNLYQQNEYGSYNQPLLDKILFDPIPKILLKNHWTRYDYLKDKSGANRRDVFGNLMYDILKKKDDHTCVPHIVEYPRESPESKKYLLFTMYGLITLGILIPDTSEGIPPFIHPDGEKFLFSNLINP